MFETNRIEMRKERFSILTLGLGFLIMVVFVAMLMVVAVLMVMIMVVAMQHIVSMQVFRVNILMLVGSRVVVSVMVMSPCMICMIYAYVITIGFVHFIRLSTVSEIRWLFIAVVMMMVMVMIMVVM